MRETPMRSLILFFATAQITAAAIFAFFELRGADDPIGMITEFDYPIQILAAALVLSLVALLLRRYNWSRGIGLLLVLVLPILFVGYDLGLTPGFYCWD